MCFFFFSLFSLLLLLLLLTGLHVFLERLYFLRSSWVYAGGVGPQGEATAGGLRCKEEKPTLKEGESFTGCDAGQVFRVGKKNMKRSCVQCTLTKCTPVWEKSCISVSKERAESSLLANYVCSKNEFGSGVQCIHLIKQSSWVIYTRNNNIQVN